MSRHGRGRVCQNGHQTGPGQTHGAPGPVPQQLVWESWLERRQSGAEICLRPTVLAKVVTGKCRTQVLTFNPHWTVPMWAGSADTLLLISGLDISYEFTCPSSKWKEKNQSILLSEIFTSHCCRYFACPTHICTSQTMGPVKFWTLHILIP